MTTNNNNTKKNTTSAVQTSIHEMMAEAEAIKAKRLAKKAKKANNSKDTQETIKTEVVSMNTQNVRLVSRIEDDMTKTGMTWSFALIPIDQIIRDMAYQRPTSETRVRSIVKNFNWDKVDCKCVNYRPDEDKFAIMDGLHTLTALEEKGIQFIPCKVFIGKTYQEEAWMFAAQNKGIKKISTVEEFNALVEAGDDDAITIMEVLKDYKVELATQTGLKKVRSIRKLTKIMETIGEAGLRFTFQLIEDAGWANDGKAYTEASLNIGYFAYTECLKNNGAVHKTKYKYLVEILRKYKTSTQYVDAANIKYSVTYTKHPEDAVKRLIRDDLEQAGIQLQRLYGYQKNYREKFFKIVK